MPDLIDDGTWRGAALDRMSEAFPTNRGLGLMYVLMASAHRNAIDHIEQVPGNRKLNNSGKRFAPCSLTARRSEPC